MVVRNTLFAAVSAAALLSAAPAFAQAVSGQINVNGHVTATCVVVGGNSTSSFTGAIPLNELDDATTGKILPALASSTAASPAGSQTFTVSCNSGAPTVALTATSMKDSAGIETGGYTSTVDYTAELDVGLAAGGNSTTTYATPSGPQSGPGALPGPMSTSTNNVEVKVYNVNTDGGANTSVLTQGLYGTPGGSGGVINVTITPT